MDAIANFDFEAAMSEAAIPVGSDSPSSSPKASIPISFGEGYVPIPIESVLKPACDLSPSKNIFLKF